jgi:predicted DNA-binding transcriptional regulator AlpA
VPKPNSIRKLGYDIVTAGSLADSHLLDVEDVARILKCSRSILNKWRLLGKGPRFVRVGALVRYRPADVQAFIAEGVRTSTSEESSPAA